MSCRELKPHENRPGRTVLIGWDWIGTYFVSVTDTRSDGSEHYALFAGTSRYDITEVATVIALAAPYAATFRGLRETLTADRATEGYYCLTCNGRGARVLPSSSGETECTPCEGTGAVQCAHGLTLASGECERCTFEAESPAATDAARSFDARCRTQQTLLHSV